MSNKTKSESPATTSSPPGLVAEIRLLLASIPHKILFLILFGAWTGLFYYYGNPTIGYRGLTSSIFNWLEQMHAADPDEQLAGYIPMLVIGLLLWKRHDLIPLEKKVWWPALVAFGAAAFLHILGYTIQQTRVSLVAFYVGIYFLAGALWGYGWLRATFFPFFLFAFAVPLTVDMEGHTVLLRSMATKITVALSQFIGINVIQEGTLMYDPTHRFQYNVEAACSGLRSLTSMLALSCIFGFVFFKKWWKRGLLIFSAIPFAIIGNVCRLLAIIIAAEAAGQEAGNRIHNSSVFSLIPYIPAMIGLSLLARFLRDDEEPKEAA